MYSFIYENTTIIPNSEIQILETTTIPNGKKYPKVAFKARLQTAEEQNQNLRYYPKYICEEIVSCLSPKAKSRSLLQEVDHPLVNPETPEGKRRAIIVELKNCGTMIREIKMDGNHIIGEMETLSGLT